MFSVIILTLNEERDLPRCLASVAGCDDVVVLDSGSTDRTVELARAAGARVVSNRFENFAQQRNHAHAAITFRHAWVLHLDADEQMTPELAAECASHAAVEPSVDGFWVAPKMLWKGRWLPHCTDYPAGQARFVRARGFTFVEVGHGQREAPGMRMGWLRANYLHDLSSGGVDEWLEKHRRYARKEALAWWRERRPAGILLRELVSSDALTRRRALKQLSYTLPLRPLLRFVYQYGLRGGFLDGPAGLSYCRLLARYEGFAADELRQLRRAHRGRARA